MGLPKRKVSHARQGDRRSHLALTPAPVEECPRCHEPKLAHHACPSCGTYRGRPVIDVSAREKAQS